MLMVQSPGSTLSTRLCPPHTYTHSLNVKLTKQYFREVRESPEEKSRREDVPPQPPSSFYPDQIRGQADSTESCFACTDTVLYKELSPAGWW